MPSARDREPDHAFIREMEGRYLFSPTKSDADGQISILKLKVADEQGNAIGGSPAEIYLELSFPDGEKMHGFTDGIALYGFQSASEAEPACAGFSLLRQ